jgi:hypothetical protein
VRLQFRGEFPLIEAHSSTKSSAYVFRRVIAPIFVIIS